MRSGIGALCLVCVSIGALADDACDQRALRLAAELETAGVLRAGAREEARAILARDCPAEVVEPAAESTRILGVQFRKAEPKSAGNRRLSNKR